jgi:hypothetical protein
MKDLNVVRGSPAQVPWLTHAIARRGIVATSGRTSRRQSRQVCVVRASGCDLPVSFTGLEKWPTGKGGKCEVPPCVLAQYKRDRRRSGVFACADRRGLDCGCLARPGQVGAVQDGRGRDSHCGCWPASHHCHTLGSFVQLGLGPAPVHRTGGVGLWGGQRTARRSSPNQMFWVSPLPSVAIRTDRQADDSERRRRDAGRKTLCRNEARCPERDLKTGTNDIADRKVQAGFPERCFSGLRALSNDIGHASCSMTLNSIRWAFRWRRSWRRRNC